MNSGFGNVNFNHDNEFNMGFGYNNSGRRGMMPTFGRGGARSYHLDSMSSMANGFGEFFSGYGNNFNMNMDFGENSMNINMRNLQQQMQMDMEEFDMMEFDSPINPMMRGMGGNFHATPFGRGGAGKKFNNMSRGGLNFGIKKPNITAIRGRKKCDGLTSNLKQKLTIEKERLKEKNKISKTKTNEEEKCASLDLNQSENDQLGKDVSEATTSNYGIKLENESSQQMEEAEKIIGAKSDMALAISVPTEDTFAYPSRTPEEFLTKELKLSHPTGWVNDTARKKNWFVHGKEGSSGGPNNRVFSYILTIKDLMATGVAKKKKDAKNSAYRLMAIKFGEVFKLLAPQQSTDRNELDQQIESLLKIPENKMHKTSKPIVNPMVTTDPVISQTVQSLTLPSTGTKLKIEVASTKSTGETPNSAILSVKVACIPPSIAQYSQQQISSIPGHPVIALGDILRSLNFGSPVYSCVKEERVTKIGIYWRWEFTMRVSASKGQETKEYFGIATTKKDAKNQAAAAAFFSLTGQNIVPELENSVVSHNPQSPPEGRKITVLGSSVPLPATNIVTTSYPEYNHYTYTEHNMYVSRPAIHINPNFVPKPHTLMSAASSYNPGPGIPISSPVPEKKSNPLLQESYINQCDQELSSKQHNQLPKITYSSDLKTSLALTATPKLVSTSTLLKGKSGVLSQAKEKSNPVNNAHFSHAQSEQSKGDEENESLDDCLNEFENFLNDLDNPEKHTKARTGVELETD